MIPIRNTYYMLAYAFQVLRQQGYRDIATEEFASTAELLAEILIRGVRSQLKRGLGRSYVDVTEPLSSLRGKIEVTESLKTRSILRRQLVCSYDEFSLDTQMNQIIKATCTGFSPSSQRLQISNSERPTGVCVLIAIIRPIACSSTSVG